MTIKEHHLTVPRTKRFPDGDEFRYWRSNVDGLVYGQLFRKRGGRMQPYGKPSRYYGDTP